jgi:hypothetical protein
MYSEFERVPGQREMKGVKCVMYKCSVCGQSIFVEEVEVTKMEELIKGLAMKPGSVGINKTEDKGIAEEVKPESA